MGTGSSSAASHRAGYAVTCTTISSYVVMLEYGGGFPEEWGDPEVIEFDCVDKENKVTIELRRLGD